MCYLHVYSPKTGDNEKENMTEQTGKQIKYAKMYYFGT